ncbi:MAG: hypothetical protein M3355_09125 [Actinomycetota bacterium]|nr:hypothetical protein [Actinomycetota bacterium]
MPLNRIALVATLVAALIGGSTAQARHGEDHARGKADGQSRNGKATGQAKKCSKVRKVGFVVKGTFVGGDAQSVTLTVTKANRHARRSGLVTVGETYTANSERIRYVNRSGPEDAQASDKVRVKGKVTKLKRGCDSEGFTPTATIRRVKVIGPSTGG